MTDMYEATPVSQSFEHSFPGKTGIEICRCDTFHIFYTFYRMYSKMKTNENQDTMSTIDVYDTTVN